MGALSLMIMLPAVFLLALNNIRERKYYVALIALVVGIALPEVLQRITGVIPRVGVFEVSGPGLYHVWLLPIIWAQILFNKKLNPWVKVFFFVLILGWMYWAFFRRLVWISGWGPAFFGLFVVTFLKSKRLALLVVLIALIPIVLNPEYYWDRIYVQSEGEDFNRFWLWRTIIFDLVLLRADALLGTGPAGYAPYFQTYYPYIGMSAHNNYVDIFAQTGLLGFGFFVWFLVSVFRSGWKQVNRLADPFLQAFNNGVLGGFAGILSAMMLNDWFMPFAYNSTIAGFDWNVYAWILLGAMVGLKRFVNAPAPVPVSSAPVPATAPVASV
jgi:hypothetical protein